MFTRSKRRKECETGAPQARQAVSRRGWKWQRRQTRAPKPHGRAAPALRWCCHQTRASGRGLAMPPPRGRGTVRCGMLSPLRQGELHRDCCAPLSGRLAAEGDVAKKPKARLDAWADAHKRFHLSDLPIQMARELGLNPKKCGGLANHRQEPWKLPLPGSLRHAT